MKRKIIKIISAVLILAFIAQDIAWANPDMGRSVPSQNTLQIPLATGLMRGSDIRMLMEKKIQEIIRSMPLDELKKRKLNLVVEERGNRLWVSFYCDDGKLYAICATLDGRIKHKIFINDDLSTTFEGEEHVRVTPDEASNRSAFEAHQGSAPQDTLTRAPSVDVAVAGDTLQAEPGDSLQAGVAPVAKKEGGISIRKILSIYKEKYFLRFMVRTVLTLPVIAVIAYILDSFVMTGLMRGLLVNLIGAILIFPIDRNATFRHHDGKVSMYDIAAQFTVYTLGWVSATFTLAACFALFGTSIYISIIHQVLINIMVYYPLYRLIFSDMTRFTEPLANIFRLISSAPNALKPDLQVRPHRASSPGAGYQEIDDIPGFSPRKWWNDSEFKGGFKEWEFWQGMLFSDTDEWWKAEFGPRPLPHEGLDFYSYKDINGKSRQIPSGTKVHVIQGGTVTKVTDDFIGKTIFINTGIQDPLNGDRQLFVLYSHVEPEADVVEGAVFETGQLVASVAKSKKYYSRAPPHLHISLVFIPKDLPVSSLNWESIKTPAVTFINPYKEIFSGEEDLCFLEPTKKRIDKWTIGYAKEVCKDNPAYLKLIATVCSIEMTVGTAKYLGFIPMLVSISAGYPVVGTIVFAGSFFIGGLLRLFFIAYYDIKHRKDPRVKIPARLYALTWIPFHVGFLCSLRMLAFPMKNIWSLLHLWNIDYKVRYSLYRSDLDKELTREEMALLIQEPSLVLLKLFEDIDNYQKGHFEKPDTRYRRLFRIRSAKWDEKEKASTFKHLGRQKRLLLIDSKDNLDRAKAEIKAEIGKRFGQDVRKRVYFYDIKQFLIDTLNGRQGPGENKTYVAHLFEEGVDSIDEDADKPAGRSLLEGLFSFISRTGMSDELTRRLEETRKKFSDLESREKKSGSSDMAKDTPIPINTKSHLRGGDERIISTPGVNIEENGMPAEYILECLGLEGKPENIRGIDIVSKRKEYGFNIYRVRAPPYKKDGSIPRGIEILQNELVDANQIELTQMDLLYDEGGRLIAIFPVISSEMKRAYRDGKLFSMGTVMYYFDLSYYYFAVPKVGETGATAKWGDLARRVRDCRKMILEYKDSVANPVFSVNEISLGYGHYCLLEVDKESGKWEAVDLFVSGRKGVDFRLKSIPKNADLSKYQIIIPIFPTVYQPALNHSSDRGFMQTLYSKAGLQNGQKILVVGPGPGTDTWVASLKTGEEIYVVGINPMEIANIKATSQIAGFKVKTALHDNIIDDKGNPVFGRIKFDRIIWDMPSYFPGDPPHKDFTKTRLKAHWDYDYKGVVLKRFARGIPLLLAPSGHAIVWNRPDRIIASIFRRSGEDLGKGGNPIAVDVIDGDAGLMNNIYFIRFPQTPALELSSGLPAGYTLSINDPTSRDYRSSSSDMAKEPKSTPGVDMSSDGAKDEGAPRRDIILYVTDAIAKAAKFIFYLRFLGPLGKYPFIRFMTRGFVYWPLIYYTAKLFSLFIVDEGLLAFVTFSSLGIALFCVDKFSTFEKFNRKTGAFTVIVQFFTVFIFMNVTNSMTLWLCYWMAGKFAILTGWTFLAGTNWFPTLLNQSIMNAAIYYWVSRYIFKDMPGLALKIENRIRSFVGARLNLDYNVRRPLRSEDGILGKALDMVFTRSLLDQAQTGQGMFRNGDMWSHRSVFAHRSLPPVAVPVVNIPRSGSSDMAKDEARPHRLNSAAEKLWAALASGDKKACGRIIKGINNNFRPGHPLDFLVAGTGSAEELFDIVREALRDHKRLHTTFPFYTALVCALENLKQHGGDYGGLIVAGRVINNSSVRYKFVLLDRGTGFVDRKGKHAPLHMAVRQNVSMGKRGETGMGMWVTNGNSDLFSIISVDKTIGQPSVYYWRTGMKQEKFLGIAPLPGIALVDHGTMFISAIEVPLTDSGVDFIYEPRSGSSDMAKDGIDNAVEFKDGYKDRIRKARALAGLSREDVSFLSDWEITKEQLKGWEEGKRPPPGAALKKLAKILGVSISYIRSNRGGIDENAVAQKRDRAARVRKVRQLFGFGTIELSRKVAKGNHDFISRYENGRASVPLKRVYRLERAFRGEVSTKYLLAGIDEPKDWSKIGIVSGWGTRMARMMGKLGIGKERVEKDAHIWIKRLNRILQNKTRPSIDELDNIAKIYGVPPEYLIKGSNEPDWNEYKRVIKGYGKRLRKLRERNYLSQKELSDLVDVREKTIQSWEQEEFVPSKENVKKLAAKLNVSEEYITKGANPPDWKHYGVVPGYGKRIARARIKQGYTVRSFQEKFGIPRGLMTSLENQDTSEYYPKPDLLTKIAECLEVKPEFLMSNLNPPDWNNFGITRQFYARIRDAFKASDMTVAEFCERTGLTSTPLHHWMSRDKIKFPTREKLALFASALNVPFEYLKDGSNEPAWVHKDTDRAIKELREVKDAQNGIFNGKDNGYDLRMPQAVADQLRIIFALDPDILAALNNRMHLDEIWSNLVGAKEAARADRERHNGFIWVFGRRIKVNSDTSDCLFVENAATQDQLNDFNRRRLANGKPHPKSGSSDMAKDAPILTPGVGIEDGVVEWFPGKRGLRLRVGRMSLERVQSYFNYLKKTGVKNMAGLRFLVEGNYLNIMPIPVSGKKITGCDKIAHKIQLDDTGLPKGAVTNNTRPERVSLLKALELQGAPIRMFTYKNDTVCVNKFFYTFKTYLDRTGRTIEGVNITRRNLGSGKARIEVREAGIGNGFGDVIDYIDVKEDGLPVGSALVEKSSCLSYWDLLVAQGRSSLDINPEIRIALPGQTTEIRFRGLKYTKIPGYIAYLEKKGFKNIAALKFVRKEKTMELVAVVNTGRDTEEEIVTATLETDTKAYPVGVPVERRDEFDLVSVYDAVMRQGGGDAAELRVIKNANGYGFFADNTKYTLSSFLDYKGLSISQVKIIKKINPDGTGNIEVIKRATEAPAAEEVIASIDLDDNKYPVGLEAGMRTVSLLQILIRQGKIKFETPDTEVEIRRGYTDLSCAPVIYCDIGSYLDYLDYLDIGKIKKVVARKTKTAIELIVTIERDGKVFSQTLHRVSLNADRRPVDPTGEIKNYVTLLKILNIQGQLDGDSYMNFRKTRNVTRAGDYIYKTREDAEKELARRAKLPGGERNNMASVLNRGKAKGGDDTLLRACARFNIKLPQKEDKYATPEKAREELARREKLLGGKLNNTSGALRRTIKNGGDYALYKACRKFGISIEPTPKRDNGPIKPEKYPTRESISEALAARARLPGGEKNNTPKSLQRPLADGGDWTLYNACQDKGMLDILPHEEKKFAHKYNNPGEVEAELKRRSGLPGGEDNNTAKSLNRSYANGGDFALLHAAREFEISLPKARRGSREDSVDPLTSYISDASSPGIISEEKAVSLWQEALHGSRDAARELADSLRKLVVLVIREDIHIDIDVRGRSAELVEELISAGNYTICERMEEWDCSGSVIGFFRKILNEDLAKARKDYYAQMHSWQRPLDETKEAKHGRPSTAKDNIPSRELSPLDVTAILSDRDPFDVERLVMEKAAASGLPILPLSSKEELIVSLRDLFVSSETFTVFKNGHGNKWALFLIGSLGRIGTAVKDDCNCNLLVLSDMPDKIIKENMNEIAWRLKGVLFEYGDEIPTVVLGRDGDYTKLSRAPLPLLLRNFGIGSQEKGFATIEAVSVNGHEDMVDGEIPVKRAHVRALLNTAREDLSFDVGTNGLLVAESETGAAGALIDELTGKVTSSSRIDMADIKVAVQERFLERQRLHLERAKSVKSGSSDMAKDGVEPAKKSDLIKFVHNIVSETDEGKTRLLTRDLNERLPAAYDVNLVAELYSCFYNPGELDEALGKVEDLTQLSEQERPDVEIKLITLIDRIGEFSGGMRLNNNLTAILILGTINPSEGIRKAAVRALGIAQVNAGFDIHSVLRSVFESDDEKIYIKLLAVQAMSDKAFFRDLLRVLKGADSDELKVASIHEIAHLMHPISIKVIVPYAFSVNPRLVKAALQGLKDLGDPAGILVAAALMNSRDKDIAQAAKETLEHLTDLVIWTVAPLDMPISKLEGAEKSGSSDMVKEPKSTPGVDMWSGGAKDEWDRTVLIPLISVLALGLVQATGPDLGIFTVVNLWIAALALYKFFTDRPHRKRDAGWNSMAPWQRVKKILPFAAGLISATIIASIAVNMIGTDNLLGSWSVNVAIWLGIMIGGITGAIDDYIGQRLSNRKVKSNLQTLLVFFMEIFIWFQYKAVIDNLSGFGPLVKSALLVPFSFYFAVEYMLTVWWSTKGTEHEHDYNLFHEFLKYTALFIFLGPAYFVTNLIFFSLEPVMSGILLLTLLQARGIVSDIVGDTLLNNEKPILGLFKKYFKHDDTQKDVKGIRPSGKFLSLKPAVMTLAVAILPTTVITTKLLAPYTVLGVAILGVAAVYLIRARQNRAPPVEKNDKSGSSDMVKEPKSTPGVDMWSGGAKDDLKPLLTINIRASKGPSRAAAEKIKRFIEDNTDIISSREMDIEDVLEELAYNMAEHGGGGVMQLLFKERHGDAPARLIVKARDQGKGLPVHPDELVRRSIGAPAESKRGRGFSRIAFVPDFVNIEYGGLKFRRISNKKDGKKWFSEKRGESNVVRGTVFTLEFLLPKPVYLTELFLKSGDNFEKSLKSIWGEALKQAAAKHSKGDMELFKKSLTSDEIDHVAHEKLRYYLGCAIAADMSSLVEGVNRAWIRGSVSRNSDDVWPASDIDLLVEVSSEIARKKAIIYLYYVNRFITREYNSLMAKSGVNINSLLDTTDKIFLPEDIEKGAGFAASIGALYEPVLLIYDRAVTKSGSSDMVKDEEYLPGPVMPEIESLDPIERLLAAHILEGLGPRSAPNAIQDAVDQIAAIRYLRDMYSEDFGGRTIMIGKVGIDTNEYFISKVAYLPVLKTLLANEIVTYSRASLPPRPSALSIGVGTGILEKELIDCWGLDVAGVDISEPLLAKARKRGIKTRLAHGEHLPYPDGSFDIVIMSESIGHFDLNRVLAEACRVLRPGGTIHINTYPPSARLVDRFRYKQYTAGEITSAMRLNGFIDCENAKALLDAKGFTEYLYIRGKKPLAGSVETVMVPGANGGRTGSPDMARDEVAESKIDERPAENGILNRMFVGYDMAIRKLVNPRNAAGKTALYAGSGVDWSNFVLSTDATNAIFVDTTSVDADDLARILKYHWNGLGNRKEHLLDSGDRSILSAYTVSKYSNGYGLSAGKSFEHAALKLLFELRCMGVEKFKPDGSDNIEINTDADGNVSVGFYWAYHGQNVKRYTITFINADITDPDSYPASLAKILSSGIDYYYQKAGFMIAGSYATFLPRIASSIKPGGFLITNDYSHDGQRVQRHNPESYLLSAGPSGFVFREQTASPEIAKWAASIDVHENDKGDPLRYYGWKMRIRRMTSEDAPVDYWDDISLMANAAPNTNYWEGRLKKDFPNLTSYTVRGPDTNTYNCFAYTLGITHKEASPRPRDRDYPEVIDVDRFYLEYGYLPVGTQEEAEIALFTNWAVPAHVAVRRQGGWESKIGDGPLILHRLEDLEGGIYGFVTRYYAKERTGSSDMAKDEEAVPDIDIEAVKVIVRNTPLSTCLANSCMLIYCLRSLGEEAYLAGMFRKNEDMPFQYLVSTKKWGDIDIFPDTTETLDYDRTAEADVADYERGIAYLKEKGYLARADQELAKIKSGFPDMAKDEKSIPGVDIGASHDTRQQIVETALKARRWIFRPENPMQKHLCNGIEFVVSLAIDGAIPVWSDELFQTWTEVGDVDDGWLVDVYPEGVPGEIAEKIKKWTTDGIVVMPLAEGRRIYGKGRYYFPEGAFIWRDAVMTILKGTTREAMLDFVMPAKGTEVFEALRIMREALGEKLAASPEMGEDRTSSSDMARERLGANGTDNVSYAIKPLTAEFAEKYADRLVELDHLILVSPTQHSAWTKDGLLAERWKSGEFGVTGGDRVFWFKYEHSFVAVDENDRPIGFLMAYERPGGELNNVGEVSLYLHRISVDPNYQGMGVATKLILAAARGLKEKGFLRNWGYQGTPLVSLQTGVINEKAIRLYEKLGFKKVGSKEYPDRRDNIYLATADDIVASATPEMNKARTGSSDMVRERKGGVDQNEYGLAGLPFPWKGYNIPIFGSTDECDGLTPSKTQDTLGCATLVLSTWGDKELREVLEHPSDDNMYDDLLEPQPPLPFIAHDTDKDRTGSSDPTRDGTNPAQHKEPVLFLRNIIDTEKLSQNMIEGILSALFSNKKLTLAFNKKLKGLESAQLRALVRKLKDWKEATAQKNKRMKALLDNFTVFEYDAELKTELEKRGIDINAKDGLIFDYAPKPADDTVSAATGTAVKQVYIVEQEGGFPANYYYPLLEMVTVSIAKELLQWDDASLREALAASDISVDTFGIETIVDEKYGYLIFRVLPRIERYSNNDRIDRYTRLLQFLHSA